MTTQKHLHELLKEDQEPFHLKNFIADRKCQLKRLNSHKHIIKTSPITTSSKRNFCKHSCFLAFQASPEVTKSPFPSFLSPARSPCRNHKGIGIGSGSVFLHIPSRTASLLLDAALKIQKQQSSKPKTQIKNLGLGLFSSILKKLKDRKRNRKTEIEYGEVKSSINSDVATFGSLDCSRRSSVEWSERNEERTYLDIMEASTSSSYESSKETDDFVAQEGENYGLNSFCSSPHSPFRFSLQKASSSGECTPIFNSPSASPSRRKEQKKEKFDVNLLEKFGIEEDEKEQSSPVSVLDPPFENEDDEHESLDDDDDEDEEDYDVECSFTLVQKAKEQLLYKLSRFEKLAELDPVELEKRMQDEDEDEEMCTCDGELSSAYKSCNTDSYVNEVLSKSGLLQSHRKKVPRDMDRLVSDLIAEEEKSNRWFENGEILVGRVCRKLECWKEAKSNTIDMMAGMDMRIELDQWKRFQEQKEETGMEFEVAILGVLLDELTYELLQLSK